MTEQRWILAVLRVIGTSQRMISYSCLTMEYKNLTI